MAITGAFRTTPTLALEWLLELTPLHTHIQTEARKSLYRLAKAGDWNHNRPCTNHTSTDPVKELDNLIDMPCDRINAVHMFNKRFGVRIPTRDEWKKGLRPADSTDLIWYTDGSKMKSGTGAGIYSKDYRYSQSMGHYASIFQAETYAIVASIKEMQRRNVKGKTINILSDSQAVLKALNSAKITSKLVKEGVTSLNNLGKHNKVHLTWVPGHEGIQGNEKADELARAGSNTNLTGPEPFVGIPHGAYNQALQAHAREEQIKEWRQTTGLTHSKTFSSTRHDCGVKLLHLNRIQLRHLMGALTGHFSTKEHLYRMRLSATDTCRFCMGEKESMLHLLCDCDALIARRLNHLGVACPTPDDYAQLQVGAIIKYLRDLLDAPTTG